MKIDVTTLDAGKAGTVDLNEAIFGLEARKDILQRMVVFQQAKKRQGTHKIQSRGEVSRSKTRLYRQKGTGRARQGSGSAGHFRGGAKSFGPVVRDHSIKLPKKVRVLALKHALSSKQGADQLVILDEAKLKDPKTKTLKEAFGKLGLSNALIIGGAELDANFSLAARRIENVDVLPAQGINVYDILRREKLVLTKAALEQLEARLG